MELKEIIKGWSIVKKAGRVYAEGIEEKDLLLLIENYKSQSQTIENLNKRVEEKDYQFNEIKKIIKANTNVNGLMDADAIGFDLCRHFSYDEEDIVYGSIPVMEKNQKLQEQLKMLRILAGNVCQQFGHYDNEHLEALKKELNLDK